MSLLINALIEKNLLTKAQLDDAREKQLGAKRPVHELLVDMGFVSEEDMLATASRVFNMPVVDLEKETIDASAHELITFEIAKRYGVLPIRIVNQRLVLASSNPRDFSTQEDVRGIVAMDIDFILSSKEQIGKFIEKYYGTL